LDNKGIELRRDILSSDLPDTGSWRFLRAVLPPFRHLGDNYTALLRYARALDSEHTETEQLVTTLSQRINSLGSDLEALNRNHKSLQYLNQDLERTVEELSTQKQRLLDESQMLSEEKQQLQIELDTLFAEKDDLLSDKEDLQQRYDLVSTAISARGDVTPKYQALSEIFENEFLPFTSGTNVLKGEAEAIIRMRGVIDQLRVIESMARFMDKTVVALSGGFSSGKSTFINSMLSGHSMKLPVGMERMTAIPTYVGHGQDTRILGYSANGGLVEIPANLYNQLSHAYVKAFDFNLRDLLPYIAIETPLRDLENISFIDLPGYDPGASAAYTDSDDVAASEFLERAHALIWVIGLDSNGTLPSSDIEFLSNHAHRVEKVYIVINKADLRHASDLSAVMEEVRDTLEISGIDYEGITLYSSERAQEYGYLGSSLTETLSRWNAQHNSLAEITTEIDAVFSLYYQAFDEEIEHREAMSAQAHDLELDLMEIGAFNDQSDSGDFKDILRKYGGARSGLGSTASSGTVKRSDQDKLSGIDSERRERKIGDIKNYISQLKVAYSVESIEDQKAYALAIHKRMLSVL